MAGPPLQKRRKGVSVLFVAVFAADEAVFEDVPSPRLFEIHVARLQNVGDLVGVRNGHGAGALLVRRGVQRDRQIERDALLGKGEHLGHEAARRKAYVARADVDAALHREKAQKSDNVIVIIEGFAAAHEHDVMHGAVFERSSLRAVDDEDLGKDLPRR